MRPILTLVAAAIVAFVLPRSRPGGTFGGGASPGTKDVLLALQRSLRGC